MARRREAQKRQVLPDPKYKEELVTRFVNCMMKDGKKSSDGTVPSGGMPSGPTMPDMSDALAFVPIAGPNYISMQYRTKRAEVPTNMKAIKTALISYESLNDVFVACSAYPSIPTKTTQQWTKGASGGFATLNWQPDGAVRGSYQVSTTSTNFIITGLSDVDGDGNVATYVATRTENTMLITAPDVY